MYWEVTHCLMTEESKRLEEEANKMGINRQTAQSPSDDFVETDTSLIHRMYCRWAGIKPSTLEFWSKHSPYGPRRYICNVTYSAINKEDEILL